MGFKEKSNLSLVFRRIVIQPTHFSKKSQELVFERNFKILLHGIFPDDFLRLMYLGQQFAKFFQLATIEPTLLRRFTSNQSEKRNVRFTSSYSQLTRLGCNRMCDVRNTNFVKEVVSEPKGGVGNIIISINFQEKSLVI